MNWYLSTAFMPESLLQLLAIGFMVFVLGYARKSTWGAFVGLLITGLLGLLVKFPGFVHLGFFAALVLVDRQGWRVLLRPVLWVASAVIGAAVFGWGEYVKAINAEYFPYWAGTENLLGFIQPGRSRLAFSYYIPLVGYNLAFVLPLLVAPFALLGAVRICRRARVSFGDRIWLYLAASLLLYWLIWAKAAPSHGYYNLQNLVLFSALFGLGVTQTLRWMAARNVPAWLPSLARSLIVLALLSSGFVGYRYLSRPDYITVEVAQWVKTNTNPNDIILYQPRHVAAVIDYQHQPILSHLAGRRTWVWTRTTPDWEKERSVKAASYLITSHPLRNASLLEVVRQHFKGAPNNPPESVADLHTDDIIAQVYDGELYTVFELSKTQPGPR
jgi:hypothetical protein